MSQQGKPVVQRMRWIPPGQFMMGSPEDEPGRYDDEGPQHKVTIRKGYWLFDTPVTQALWTAVMARKNPSDFKSPDRPVEQVYWEDVRAFLSAINKRHSVGLSLPSEAQWEYACRAGTTTALYTGPIEILGERNAPALDPIAWYGGNSGVEFELVHGQDSMGWNEKQYIHAQAGTRPVGRKRANPWGLYDMLGNVWEWCEDPWHRNYDGAPKDEKIWIDEKRTKQDTEGLIRVIRGGSWFNYAEHARSAFRNRSQPDRRSNILGFRCARVQE
ncbi:MAG: formylglycine-generating enzyme family protein [Magnetococcales bacterium]|nr:formylglycine-generating enzyme family protein [Magnetococcales bacterium]